MSSTSTEFLSDNEILILYAKNIFEYGEDHIKKGLMERWTLHQTENPLKAKKYSKIMSSIDLNNELELCTNQLQLLLETLQNIS